MRGERVSKAIRRRQLRWGCFFFTKREKEEEVATDADAYRGRPARREDTRRHGLCPLGMGRVLDDLARVRDFGLRAPP